MISNNIFPPIMFIINILISIKFNYIKFNQTPLIIAIRQRNPEIVKLLLSKKETNVNSILI